MIVVNIAFGISLIATLCVAWERKLTQDQGVAVGLLNLLNVGALVGLGLAVGPSNLLTFVLTGLTWVHIHYLVTARADIR